VRRGPFFVFQPRIPGSSGGISGRGIITPLQMSLISKVPLPFSSTIKWYSTLAESHPSTSKKPWISFVQFSLHASSASCADPLVDSKRELRRIVLTNMGISLLFLFYSICSSCISQTPSQLSWLNQNQIANGNSANNTQGPVLPKFLLRMTYSLVFCSCGCILYIKK